MDLFTQLIEIYSSLFKLTYPQPHKLIKSLVLLSIN